MGNTLEEGTSVNGLVEENCSDNLVFDQEDVDDVGPFQIDEEELFVKSLAITYNSWANVNHIPHSTVNQIVAEIFKSYHLGIVHTKRNIETALIKEGLDSHLVNTLLEKMDEDPFDKARQELEKEKKRENYLLTSFPNIQPQTINLNNGSSSVKSDTMQYISIKDSLKQLLEDETFLTQKKNDPYFHKVGLVKDLRDSSNFRSNSFFTENPDAVPIILFQDELEVVNPLGAQKE